MDKAYKSGWLLRSSHKKRSFKSTGYKNKPQLLHNVYKIEILLDPEKDLKEINEMYLSIMAIY